MCPEEQLTQEQLLQVLFTIYSYATPLEYIKFGFFQIFRFPFAVYVHKNKMYVQLGAPRSRTTILDPLADGVPISPRRLIDLDDIKFENVNEFIGQDDTSEHLEKTLKFAAKYKFVFEWF